MPTAELILLMLAHRDTYRLASQRLDEAIRAIESTNPVHIVERIAAVAASRPDNGGQVAAPRPSPNGPEWPAVPVASTDAGKLHTPLFDALEQGASVAMPPTAEAPRPVADPEHPHGGGAS
jgi:hypothetical protein